MSGIEEGNQAQPKKPSKLAIALGLSTNQAGHVARQGLSTFPNEQIAQIPQPERHNQIILREMELYPCVQADRLFPMMLSQFLSGVKKVVIKFNNGNPITQDKQQFIQRTLTKSGGGTISLYSEYITSNPKAKQIKNMVSLLGTVMIDHRLLNNEKTQFTVMGSGGKIWVEGDDVVMHMDNGEERSFEEWRKIAEGNL